MFSWQATDNLCQEAKRDRHVVTIDDYADVPPNDENALAQAVTHQPVSVRRCSNMQLLLASS